MASNFRRFIGGFQVLGTSSSAVSLAGEVEFLSSSNKLNVHNGTSSSPIVTEAHQATLTNKNLTDNTVVFVGNLDSTKVAKFNLAGSTASTTTTFSTSSTVNRTITFPDGTDTVCLIALAQVLTSKTMDGGSNTFTNIGDASLATSYIKADGSRALTGNWAAGAFSITANSVVVGGSANQVSGVAALVSNTANRAASGVIRLANADSIAWRNTGNSADLLLGVGASDGLLNYNAVALVGVSLTQTLSNKTFGDGPTFTQISTPSSPSSGFNKIYPKSDGFFYTLDSTGAEKKVGSGSGSINYFSTNTDFTSSTTGYSTLTDGDTFTVTLASPAVFTSAHTHGMAVGQPMFLTTTGALPTGLATGTQYYVSNVPSGTTFRLSATLGGADINTSVSQSGVHTYRPNVPVTGALANIAATATIASSTNSTLRNAKNGLFTPGSVGDYLVYTITPDPADAATVLQFSFDYLITTPASYVDGDLQVYFYDVGNSQLLQPAPYKILGNSKPGHFQAVFQTPGSNLSTIRMVIIQATTNTAYTSFRLTNLACGPQTRSLGPAMTDWTSYTATGSWVSNSTYSGFYRRVGDTLDVFVKIALGGAPTATALTVNLPPGLSIDTTKITSTIADSTPKIGYGYGRQNGTAEFSLQVRYSSTTAVGVTVERADSTFISFSNVSATSPVTWANTDALEIYFTVPITGWSTSTLQSSDTDTRICAARFNYAGSAYSLSNGVNANTKFDTVDYDTHGALITGASAAFVAPLPGYYQVEAEYEFAANATGQRSIGIFKNGAQISELAQNPAPSGALTNRLSGADTIKLVAGDNVQIYAFQSSGGALNIAGSGGTFSHASFFRLTGPASIQTTETVAARGTNTAGTSIVTSTDTLLTMVVDFDTHGALATGGLFTAPVSGKYAIKGCVTFVDTIGTGNLIAMKFKKNGSTQLNEIRLAAFSASSNYYSCSGADTVRLLAGDTVGIYAWQNSGAGKVLSALAGQNYFAVERIGNY